MAQNLWSMLIPFSQICQFLEANNKKVTGILHVGAHECEEKKDYNDQGIPDNKIIWVEGNKDKVLEMRMKGIDTIYCAVVDEVERDVTFHITNNGQSSSILPLEKHSNYYPHIVVTEERKVKTTTLKHLIEESKMPIQELNFWNFDIQGAELSALKGAGEYLKHADFIYVEVNIESLYRGCPLLPEIDSFLEANGFQRCGMKLVVQGWGDALYVRV
jgi:FkbM family methyltransferase